MKIPETSANVGAYYGNEENGQWQPNGVIVDNGVGGGVVGSGDAGVRPVYPVHIPRHMAAGYVMAGAYYPPQFAPPAPPQPADFEDYMWMENEEEFDKQVIQQLEEEALMEQCIEAMLEDEQRERRQARGPRQPRDPNAPTTSACNGTPGVSLQETVSRSTLNPLAAEFVPTRVRLPPANPDPPKSTDEKAETTEEPKPSRTECEAAESTPDVGDDAQPEVAGPPPPPADPPEVSAAGVHLSQKHKPRDKRPESKRPPKIVQEVKKAKPVVKSDSKVPREAEIKASSEQDNSASKGDSPPECAPKKADDDAFPGLKPINYAAAAKAMKPRPKPTEKEMKPAEKETKSAEKELKPAEKETKPAEKEKKEQKVKSAVKTNKDKVRKTSTK